MRMRRLGNSGLFISEFCFGAMTFGGRDGIWGQVGRLGQDDADALVRAALDAGINVIDTANTYADGRSEQMVGQSLRNLGVARDDVVIATKVAAPVGDGPNACGGSRRHILSQCRGSLQRLGLDHIDLYQIHEFDPATPSTRRRRSRKRLRRWTCWFARGMSAMSACRTGLPGRS
ncbi:aldo/keto reductase [Tistrella bauzanensis]